MSSKIEVDRDALLVAANRLSDRGQTQVAAPLWEALAAPVVERQREIDGVNCQNPECSALIPHGAKCGYCAPPELAELQAVTLPSVQDDGAEGRGYNKALRDCAAALEAAGVPFTNDPRASK